MQLAITDIPGFRCWGAHIGIKSKRRDLAMIVCDEPATAAAVFTQNVVVAEPVKLSRRHIKDGKAQAFVVNSGNANACTGKDGEKGAVAMAEAAAEALGIDKKLVIVSSTGLIGEPFPTKKVVQGIHDNVIKLTRRGVASTLCANAILTTDTFAKEAGEQFEIDGTKVGISGIAKGSGMIHPNMATMLAFIVSDVKITKNLLNEALKESVGRTFNMITVDGDTSTNDMVAIMCSGKADHPVIRQKDKAYQSFRRALAQICEQLARLIVSDGEGATKFVEYVVEGARDDEAARKIARTVSDSTLVKTAIFGHDPNWGRIMGAAGRAGVDFDPDKVDLSITAGETLKIVEGGQPVKIRRSTLAKRMKESFLKVTIGLNEGSGRAVSWGTDLSYEYVRINAEYTT